MTQFVEQNAPSNDNPPVMDYPLYLAPLVLYAAGSVARSRAGAHAAGEPARAAPATPPDGRGRRRPRIDPLKCIGCGACIVACPEQMRHLVLGLVANKAELLSPQHCQGRGGCSAACPTSAITLEFA